MSAALKTTISQYKAGCGLMICSVIGNLLFTEIQICVPFKTTKKILFSSKCFLFFYCDKKAATLPHGLQTFHLHAWINSIKSTLSPTSVASCLIVFVVAAHCWNMMLVKSKNDKLLTVGDSSDDNF